MNEICQSYFEGTEGREVFADMKFSLYFQLDSYRENIHKIITATLQLASICEI